ncbi:MAG: glycosyltransferase [Acidimicrobiales bacterium]
MARPPVSIVILAWNAWEDTQACLESLRPTMGVRDQVVVVDNGSVDATPSRLRLYPWVEVVTNAENRGFAAGCNQGAAVARHELLVFLDNDTVLTGRWIDALIEPFTDQQVGAGGPRSNLVSGPQVADGASYLPGDMVGMRSFARRWSEAHRGMTTPTNRLVGFCLAVRHKAFDQVDGFDEGYEIGGFEDDDLCRRLSDANWKLVIAHGSFVHHRGHGSLDANGVDRLRQREIHRGRLMAKFGNQSFRDFPLVSACLIIKDEEENLPGCLASLEGFADEVVIYDTGSTDRSVEVARRLGATVHEGYWDDDFSRARNASLEHCQGEWIAWLDADETLVCDDIPALRQTLMRTPTRFDGYSVVIENLTGAGVSSMFVHSACRLFRRAACQWAGRIHEQVAVRQDPRMVELVALDDARILHTGYLAKTMVDRDKAARNLRLAETEVGTASGLDEGFSLTSLGRSHMTAGHFAEAFEYCRQGCEATTNQVTRRLALRTAAEALTMMGRFDEGLEWIAKLRQASRNQVLADLLEGNLRRQQGEYELALSMYDRLRTRQFDDDGFEYDISMFSHFRAEAQAALGRFDEAAESLLDALHAKGILDTHLGTLVDYLDRAGRPLNDLAQAIPSERVQMFLAQVLQLRPELADRVLEACWESLGQEIPVLATVVSLASRLPVQRSLVWSARLRQQGLIEGCPLISVASDAGVLPSIRIRSASTAHAAFKDERAPALLAETARQLVGTSERDASRLEVAALAPDLLDVFDRACPAQQPI